MDILLTISKYIINFAVLISQIMLKYFNILCLFGILFMTSCEEDFIIDTGTFKPKVTVNSLFKPDAPWQVHLSFSKSAFAGDTEIENIKNARVFVYDLRNNLEIFLKHKEDGLYVSEDFKPTHNRQYELVITVEGYDKITARSSIPSKANLIQVQRNIVERKVEFQIQNEEPNIYIWNFLNGANVNDIRNNNNSTPSSIVKGIITYNNASDFIQNVSNASNQAVGSGGSFSADLNTSSQDSTSLVTQDSLVTKKFLRLLTASEDFFKFYKDYERYFANSGFQSSAANPPIQFSNIKNGIGIFAGYTEEFREID